MLAVLTLLFFFLAASVCGDCEQLCQQRHTAVHEHQHRQPMEWTHDKIRVLEVSPQSVVL